MINRLRGELAVLALGAAMWVIGVFAPGEWGRAFTGGGIVFTVSGLALIAVGLISQENARAAHAGPSSAVLTLSAMAPDVTNKLNTAVQASHGLPALGTSGSRHERALRYSVESVSSAGQGGPFRSKPTISAAWRRPFGNSSRTSQRQAATIARTSRRHSWSRFWSTPG